jgi:hypothetical protein
MYFISIPVLGLGHYLQERTVYENIIKRIPSFSKALKIKFCVGQYLPENCPFLIRLDWSPLPIHSSSFAILNIEKLLDKILIYLNCLIDILLVPKP